MKVPKYIKNLIKQRERVAITLVALDSKLNTWLDKKGIFEKVTCGEYSSLFNTGCQELESGSASATIKYLENINV